LLFAVKAGGAEMKAVVLSCALLSSILYPSLSSAVAITISGRVMTCPEGDPSAGEPIVGKTVGIYRVTGYARGVPIITSLGGATTNESGVWSTTITFSQGCGSWQIMASTFNNVAKCQQTCCLNRVMTLDCTTGYMGFPDLHLKCGASPLPPCPRIP
jgi:hypothetical protein